MDQDTKEIVASNLTLAFYTATERRPGYLGEERRAEDALVEGQRDLRTENVTPYEIHGTFQRFMDILSWRDDI